MFGESAEQVDVAPPVGHDPRHFDGPEFAGPEREVAGTLDLERMNQRRLQRPDHGREPPGLTRDLAGRLASADADHSPGFCDRPECEVCVPRLDPVRRPNPNARMRRLDRQILRVDRDVAQLGIDVVGVRRE